jgi:hypothetical protein
MVSYSLGCIMPMSTSFQSLLDSLARLCMWFLDYMNPQMWWIPWIINEDSVTGSSTLCDSESVSKGDPAWRRKQKWTLLFVPGAKEWPRTFVFYDKRIPVPLLSGWIVVWRTAFPVWTKYCAMRVGSEPVTVMMKHTNGLNDWWDQITLSQLMRSGSRRELGAIKSFGPVTFI